MACPPPKANPAKKLNRFRRRPTYISPSLRAFGQSDRKVRIASKIIDSPVAYAFATVKDEIVIRQKPGGKTGIRAKFFEDDRGIFVLTIEGYTVATEKPHNAQFSFAGKEISTLLEFVANCRTVVFENTGRLGIPDEELRRIALSKRQALSLIADNEELFADVLASAITREDVVALGYRKRQLETFRRLLEEPNYFEKAKAEKHCSNEGVWQAYFEKNPWIFGYGLTYLYLNRLSDQKLEQVVQGFRIGSHGKRADALMKTRGAISSLCFVEIKTHGTPLLTDKSYRSGCWAPSPQLAGGVSQIQGTVASAMDTIRSKFSLKDTEGFPVDDEAYNFAPKSFLVVGSLGQFVRDGAVSEDQFRSFELFRRNTLAPEIITFDELYARAHSIVEQSDH